MTEQYIMNYASTSYKEFCGYIRSFLPAKIFNRNSKTVKMCCTNIINVWHPLYQKSNTVTFNTLCNPEVLKAIQQYIHGKKTHNIFMC